MSEFQIALLVIGALVVAGVLVYNKSLERRARRAAHETFKSRHSDVLMDATVSAPHLRQATTTDTRIEPGLTPRSEPAKGAPVRGNDPMLPDPLVDYVVDLVSDQPIAIAALREFWSQSEHRFARRAILAARIDGRWTALPQQGAVERVQAAFQLTSRAGVVSEAELLEFRSAVETLGAKLGASTASPEMRQALEAARELDAACAEADIQIAFHIVSAPGSSFQGTKLRAAAEASGFALDTQGRFELRDENDQELFALVDRSGGRFTSATMKDSMPLALTLCMDVPRAPDTQRTFESMVRFARHLAALMGGTVVDDNNQPLDDRSVAAIDAQLIVVRRGLEAHGIGPGSALALRVFS